MFTDLLLLVSVGKLSLAHLADPSFVDFIIFWSAASQLAII